MRSYSRLASSNIFTFTTEQFGKPLYGDVFGIAAAEQLSDMAEPIDKKHWGELEDEEFESEEEEEEEEGSEEEEEAEETPQPLVARPPQPAMDDGLETPTGIATPDHLVLRKKIDAPEEPRALYKASFPPLLLSHSPSNA